MSTILKALRRLEEDRSPAPAVDPASDTPAPSEVATGEAAGGNPPPLPATDPADQLRDRILAEEAAARAVHAKDDEPGPLAALLADKRIVLAASMVALLFAAGLAGYSLSGARPNAPTTTPASATATPTAQADPALASAPRPPAPQGRSEIAAAAPARVPHSNDAIGAAGAIGSVDARVAGSEAAPVEPRTSESSPVVAPIPIVATEQSSSPSSPSPSPSPSTGSPATDVPSPARSGRSARQTAGLNTSKRSPTPLAAITPTRSAAAVSPSPKSEVIQPIEPSGRVAIHAPSPTPPRSSATGSKTADTADTAHTTEATKPTKARPQRPSARESRTAASRPRATPAETAPAVVSARAADRSPEPGRVRVAEGKPTPPPPSRRVERIDRPSLPDVSVVRTSWHPKSDRRSARIRLEASDEILTLQEGDAVGGLVIKEITPSSVIFAAGAVEIRRRVGQSGGG